MRSVNIVKLDPDLNPSTHRGVIGAASGAGIAIGAYFAFYGAASNVLANKTTLKTGQVAFFAGAIAAAGGSVVKVPLAVCIRYASDAVTEMDVYLPCSMLATPYLY